MPIDRLAELRRILDQRPRVIVVRESADWADPVITDQTARALLERVLAASYASDGIFPEPEISARAHVYVLHQQA